MVPEEHLLLAFDSRHADKRSDHRVVGFHWDLGTHCCAVGCGSDTAEESYEVDLMSDS